MILDVEVLQHLILGLGLGLMRDVRDVLNRNMHRSRRLFHLLCLVQVVSSDALMFQGPFHWLSFRLKLIALQNTFLL